MTKNKPPVPDFPDRKANAEDAVGLGVNGQLEAETIGAAVRGDKIRGDEELGQTGRRVARNLSVLMATQLTTWVISLIATIFIPRYLGPAAVSKIHLASSLWAIVVMLSTFGMDLLLTKQIARQPEQTATLFGTSTVLRMLLYVLFAAGTAGYVALSGYPSETVQVIAILGVSNLIILITGAATASLQGIEQMQYISIGNIVAKASNAFISITLLLMGYGVLVVAAVSILTVSLNLIIQLFYLRRRQPIRLVFDHTLAARMLRQSLPYLLTGFFIVVYLQIDVIVISLVVENEAVLGWYSVTDQLFGTLLFVPNVFMTAIYPALSRLFAAESDGFPRLTQKSFDLMVLLSVPIGLGISVVANPLVILLYGTDFANAGPVLAVRGFVTTLTYLNVVLGMFLISMDRQRAWTIIMAIGAVATIPLDLFLIPWFQEQYGNGAIGGSVTYLVTECFIMVAAFYLLPRGSLRPQNGWYALKTVAAGLVMAGVAWQWREASLVVPILIGAAVYAIMIAALRLIPPEDFALIKGGVLALRARMAGSRH